MEAGHTAHCQPELAEVWEMVVKEVSVPCRGDYIHFNVGIWPWMADAANMDLNDSLTRVSQHVWSTVAEKEPAMAELMMSSKRDSMGVDEGVPGTGFTGGYIGRGSSLLHTDRRCIGLTALLQLFTVWGVGSWLVLPSSRQLYTFSVGT